MGRLYAVTFENVSVSAQVDFFELSPADDKALLIHGLYLSQSSDVGDAAEEMLRVQILRGHTTSGSGGSAATPAPLPSSAGVAAGFAAETNNTTIASAGTAVALHSEAFNIRAGLQYIPTPEARPGASRANVTLVVRLMAAPADALSVSGTLIVEEMG
jgi:hypothetical protein